MENIFGNSPVSGKSFYGRILFVKSIKSMLLAKNSFLLLGLRRTGKSSVLAEVTRQIKEENNQVIVINLNCQTYESIQDLYKNIYQNLPLSWQSKIKKQLKESKKLPAKIFDFLTDQIEEINLAEIGTIKFRNDVIKYSNAIQEEIKAFFQQEEKQVILILDELPFLFENISSLNNDTTKHEIEMVLSILRSWREIGVSVALCGSLNLQIQLDKLKISRKLLAGVTSQSLPKFTTEEAKGLLKKLAENTEISFADEHLNEIIRLMPDCIPQFLQAFFFYLRLHWDNELKSISEIYKQYVYPIIVKDFEYQFNEKFTLMTNENSKAVKSILAQVLLEPGLSEANLLNKIKEKNVYTVLQELVYQEFLTIDIDNRVDFSFEIVRHWWDKKSK